MYLGHISIANLRSIMAFVLALWCAGAGCMVVSYAHTAASENRDPGNSHSAVQTASRTAASMGDHSCCQARRSSIKRNAGEAKHESDSTSGFEQISLPESPGPSGAMSCCPLRSGSFVVSTPTCSDNADESALALPDSLSLPVTSSQSLRAHPLCLPGQNQTYLRCCTFLI